MSAALQLPLIWAEENHRQRSSQRGRHRSSTIVQGHDGRSESAESLPEISLAFYRKHTEKMLQRYMYASMLVGRAPAMLSEPIARGWATCRRVKTFEDAVIFVLDMERCLSRLGEGDQALLGRIALQEYTHAEAADLLGFSVRAISYKYPLALDRLTELLLKAGLLILPKD
jgi:DNA-directed RNA polymerase specialized sigma24 family protein